MKFDNKCICCGSDSNLDTVLTVTVDDVKYQVAICDEHAEDITPKQVKEKVRAKIDEYNQLVEKMKEFGMDVTESSPGGLVVAKDTTKPEVEEEEPQEEKQGPKKRKILLANAEGETVAEKETGKQPMVVKKKTLPKVRSVSGTLASEVGRMGVEARESLDAARAVESEVDAANKGRKDEERVETLVTEDIEYQTVPGRGGKPMRIPKKIKHNRGSTKVAIVDTGGDRTIQDRFREMADISMRTGMEGHIYGRDGYDTVPCAMCEGSGIAKATSEECPKCKGVGQLNRGWVRNAKG